MSDNNSTGWRPAKGHGLPDGTMVEVRHGDDTRWLGYVASDKHRSGYATYPPSTMASAIFSWPDGAEVRPLIPADEADSEWVPLTAEQAQRVEKGTTVRVDGVGATATGALDRIMFRENDEDVLAYVGSREGRLWYVRGTVSVSPEVAARVIEQADPVSKAVGNILEGYDARVPLSEFFIELREAGFEVVRREER